VHLAGGEIRRRRLVEQLAVAAHSMKWIREIIGYRRSASTVKITAASPAVDQQAVLGGVDVGDAA